MAKVKYLYGAAVQGIQSFIFQTNKLREIVGASELVYKVCTDAFCEFSNQGEIIQRAAGGIKHIFDCKEDCEKAVLNFPKKVMEMAPGITVSQAVVKFNENNAEDSERSENLDENIFPSFKTAVNELERRLRIQRNRPIRSMTCGLVGVERSRLTGLPAIKIEEEQYLDIATLSKRGENKNANQKLCEQSFGKGNFSSHQLIFEIDKMTAQNDWLAIIHIDGNGLGQVVQAIGTQKDQFKKFSEQLEEITIGAAQSAFHTLKIKYGFSSSIPLRPIVLSGDDHTLICRADLAIEYVDAYFRAFESGTSKLSGILSEGGLTFNHLTACAGIAFVKSSYPFHYGYHLAEKLCERAKRDAKLEKHKLNGLPQSCLMFHKVQDSFIESYEAIVERELKPQKDLTFEFGPYYLRGAVKERWKIERIGECVKILNSESEIGLKSNLRQWLTLLYKNSDAAAQKLERLKTLVGKDRWPGIEDMIKPVAGRIAVYDLLVIDTMLNQETKEVYNGKNR